MCVGGVVEVWMVKGGMEETDMLTMGKVRMEIDKRVFSSLSFSIVDFVK